MMWTLKKITISITQSHAWRADLLFVRLDLYFEIIDEEHVPIWSLFVDSPLPSTYISSSPHVSLFFILFSIVYLTQTRERSSSQTLAYMVHKSLPNWCHKSRFRQLKNDTTAHQSLIYIIVFHSFVWWIICLRLAINIVCNICLLVMILFVT